MSPSASPSTLKHAHLRIHRTELQTLVGGRQRETHFHLSVLADEPPVVADAFGAGGARAEAGGAKPVVRELDGGCQLRGQHVRIRPVMRARLFVLGPARADGRTEVGVGPGHPHPVGAKSDTCFDEPADLRRERPVDADEVGGNQRDAGAPVIQHQCLCVKFVVDTLASTVARRITGHRTAQKRGDVDF